MQTPNLPPIRKPVEKPASNYTYLACLEEVNVVPPDIIAVFVLTGVRQREIIALPNDIASIGTSGDSPDMNSNEHGALAERHYDASYLMYVR